MSRITLYSILVGICFVGVAYGTECTSGPGYRFPITCPGLLDPTKKYCCEFSGSFRCCNEEEFSRQEEYNDETKPLALRYKRDYISSWPDYQSTYSNTDTTLSVGVIIGICLLAIIPVGLICCCCCCCACCPCYHWCHPNSSTNVTIVQPSLGGYPPAGNNGQTNFGAMSQNPPPQYAQGGYTKLSTPSDREANYIQ